MPFTTKERIYVDKDGKVVAESDPNSASLLLAAGKEVSDEMAARYNLTAETHGVPDTQPFLPGQKEGETLAADEETLRGGGGGKAVEGPAATKALSSASIGRKSAADTSKGAAKAAKSAAKPAAKAGAKK